MNVFLYTSRKKQFDIWLESNGAFKVYLFMLSLFFGLIFYKSGPMYKKKTENSILHDTKTSKVVDIFFAFFIYFWAVNFRTVLLTQFILYEITLSNSLLAIRHWSTSITKKCHRVQCTTLFLVRKEWNYWSRIWKSSPDSIPVMRYGWLFNLFNEITKITELHALNYKIL